MTDENGESQEDPDVRLSKTVTLFLINVLLALIILTLWLGPAVLIYAGLALTALTMIVIGIIATGRV